ncbi:MAG: class I SAM-dependent methyltransferase [Alphaproteobacteria bacterium]|nr:class I SAM-dependent methyltransferase [Alphaproteobacteria bacterium]
MLKKTDLPNFSDRKFWRPVEQCAVCGGPNFTTVQKAPDPHYENPGEFTISECADCGLQFLNPQPTPAYLATAYPTEYYSYQTTPQSLGQSGFTQRAKNVLRRARTRLFGWRDARFEGPGEFLDVGCGNGSFLLIMRAMGWRVRGVEVSTAAAEAARKVYGLDVFGGFLPDAHYPEATFDYIRLNHSFEHIDNPREVLREIKRIIKPGGTLFIGVPNVSSVVAKAFGPYWYNLGPPVHPYGYAPKSLSRLLTQEGFAVETVRYNSSYSGLTGSLQIYCNRGTGRPSHVGGLLANPLLKVVGAAAMAALDLIHQGDCMEIISRPVHDPATR